jgi:hypothetical protein
MAANTCGSLNPDWASLRTMLARTADESKPKPAGVLVTGDTWMRSGLWVGAGWALASPN